MPVHVLGEVDVGDFDVHGPAMEPVMKALVRCTPCGRTLQLARAFDAKHCAAPWSPSFAPGSSICCTLGPASYRGLEVRGPQGELYGTLSPHDSGAFTLTELKTRHPVLCIDGDQGGKQQLNITSFDGQPLAVAIISGGDGDHLELTVLPGVDSVLVLACVLALFILGGSIPEATEIHSTAHQGRLSLNGRLSFLSQGRPSISYVSSQRTL